MTKGITAGDISAYFPASRSYSPAAFDAACSSIARRISALGLAPGSPKLQDEISTYLERVKGLLVVRSSIDQLSDQALDLYLTYGVREEHQARICPFVKMVLDHVNTGNPTIEVLKEIYPLYTLTERGYIANMLAPLTGPELLTKLVSLLSHLNQLPVYKTDRVAFTVIQPVGSSPSSPVGSPA